MTALCLPVSEKKNFKVDLCSYMYGPSCDPWGGACFDTRGHHMKKRDKDPLLDATCQISKL